MSWMWGMQERAHFSRQTFTVKTPLNDTLSTANLFHIPNDKRYLGIGPLDLFLPLVPIHVIGPRFQEGWTQHRGLNVAHRPPPSFAAALRENPGHKAPLTATSAQRGLFVEPEQRSAPRSASAASAPPPGRWGRGNRGGKHRLAKPKSAPRQWLVRKSTRQGQGRC